MLTTLNMAGLLNAPAARLNGMGGKETSDRASAASRVPLPQSTHPSPHSGACGQRSTVDLEQKRLALFYALAFVVSLVLTVYVFGFSN
jgi:hypothetical protein